MEIIELIQYLLIFLLGAAFASFYNASIFRIEEEIPFPSILNKGSFCEGCKRELRWYELFPVLGYFLIRGRCGSCGYKVSIYYPLTEAILGLSMILLYYYQVDLKYYLLLNFLFFLASYDYQFKGFPKSIMHIFLFITGLIFLYEFFFTYDKEWLVLIVSFSIAGAIFIINIVKKSFGTGDLLVILMISFIVTLSQFVAILLFSILLSGTISIIFLSLKKFSRKDAIPFVPFIYVSYILVFPLHHYIEGYFASLLHLW